MSFWQSQSGTKMDGSAENSHVGTFKVIPDNTTATVSIKGVELKNFQGDEFYQATYKIIDGDYKGYEVRHKIKCFDADKKKRDQNVNMMMRLFKLCDKSPQHDKAPEGDDFLPLQGCIIGVKIQEWFSDGKEGNWISEIHPVDKDFVVSSGKKVEHTATHSTGELDSALTRNKAKGELDDDVPF